MMGMQATAARRTVADERYDLLAAEIDRLREENERLKEALGLTIEIPAELGLSPQRRKLVAMMLQRDRLSRESMHLAIQDCRGSRKDYTDPQMVDAMIYKIRQLFRPLGVEIKTDRGFGYYLPAESKARLRELIAAAK